MFVFPIWGHFLIPVYSTKSVKVGVIHVLLNTPHAWQVWHILGTQYMLFNE